MSHSSRVERTQIGHESTSDNMRRGQFERHQWLFQMMHDQRSNRAASTGSEIQNSQCMKVHLHDQGAVLVTVFIEGVQLGDGVIKCLSQNKLDNIIIPRVNAHQITRQLDWLEKSMKIQRRFEGSWKITQSKILLWNFN